MGYYCIDDLSLSLYLRSLKRHSILFCFTSDQIQRSQRISFLTQQSWGPNFNVDRVDFHFVWTIFSTEINANLFYNNPHYRLTVFFAYLYPFLKGVFWLQIIFCNSVGHVLTQYVSLTYLSNFIMRLVYDLISFTV